MLWWRGLRSRPLVDLLLVALSAVAVATAVLGPLLVRAIQQGSVAETIAVAGASDTSLTVYANSQGTEDLGLYVSGTAGALGPVQRGVSARLWEPLQQWTESTDNAAWVRSGTTGSGKEVHSRLRVADACATLTLTTGTCPTGPGLILVSTSDAEKHGVKVGDQLSLRIAALVQPLTYTVSGEYDPTRVTTPLTRPGQEAISTAVADGDPLVITQTQLANLPLSAQVTARLVLKTPVVLADIPLLRQAVTDLGQGVLAQPLSLVIDTRLPDTLDRVVSQTAAALVLVGVVEVQALGLALFAVVIVLGRVSRARGAEWGAGRLLGIPRARWFRSVYVEPGIALLVGVPLGYAAAVGVGYLAVRTGLRAGTPFEPWRWPVFAAAAGAGLLLLVALVAVSLPSLRRPLAELVSERSEAVGTTPLAAVAQSVAVLLAGVTVYTLLAGDVLGGRGPQIGLLAPALFALALAVVGVRLAVVLVRRRARRPARSLVGLVVARQAARAPSSLSPAVVVTVGVALVVFAGQVLALSLRNQDLKADAVVGAATVLKVVVPAGQDLQAAVGQADPTGREAMAVRERAARGSVGTQRVIAVDTSRLGAVSSWSPAWAGVDDVAAALRPSPGAPIELRGRRIDVRLDAVVVRPGAALTATKAPAEPKLAVTLDTGPRWRTVVLGTVKDKTRVQASIPCSAGCRVVDFSMSSTPLQPYEATLRITGVGTDEQPVSGTADWLSAPGRWHAQVGAYYDPNVDAFAEPTTSAAGLDIHFVDNSGGLAPAVAPSDVLDPMPVLLGPKTQEQGFGGIASTAYGVGLDGNPQLVSVVGRTTVLPRLLDDGVLTDLRNASDLVDPQDDSSAAEVWLAPGAPPSIEAALVADGFLVSGREQLTETAAALKREPTTRAASVAQTVARSAVLLTLLALVAARVADASRRRLDWRSIADAGVRRRTLRRLATVEIGVPALLGVLLGAASGVVAVLLSASRLPLVDLSTPGPPLALGLSWTLVLVTTAGSAVLVAVVAVVGAALETRTVATS